MPQTERAALAKSLLPSGSCQVAVAKMDEVIFGQPAAAVVADHAANRYRLTTTAHNR